jgi:septation ring formation regulator EzrA
MTTLTALEERVITLEDFCSEQLPHTMEAMKSGMTQMYAETVANGEAIAGLRTDLAGLETSAHRDMVALKTALDLQGDSLRKEIGVTAASLRADMTSFREAANQRFERVGGQLRGTRDDTAAIREDVAFLKHDLGFLKEEVTTLKGDVDRRFDSVDQRFNAVDQRFNAVDQRFNAVDAKLDTLIDEIRGNQK